MAQTKKKTTARTKRRKPKYTKQAQRLQKEAIFSAVLLVIAVIFIVRFHSSPQHYQLVIFYPDQETVTVRYDTNFKNAKREMQKQIDDDNGNPAILDEQGNILAIRYGVVNFRTKTCGENTTYREEISGNDGYTNGCYGADGAYLETDDRGEEVRFRLSGVTGWVKRSDVEIFNIYDSEKVQSISHYMLKDHSLIHYGTTDITKKDYAFTLNIGTADVDMGKDRLYSYDGHYFYHEYTQMIDDLRNDTYQHSLNAKAPHYNYYQFLSHRAKTSYVSKEINRYISSYLGFLQKPTQFPCAEMNSQLYEEGYSFIEAQNTYGVNALMMLALAINESNYGRSEIAITKNNLFGHAAYDYAPNENASGYKDIAAGIAAHASIFLNRGYMNPCDQSDPDSNPGPNTCYTNEASRYRGGYFGDKGSGMNVKYASDPYWGEKAAQYYRNMDAVLGGKDETRYTIKVLQQQLKTPLYSQPDTASKILFYTPPAEQYAMVIVGEVQGEEVDNNSTWYKVQSDGVLNNARNMLVVEPDHYNHHNDIVYIPAAYFH